MSAIYLDNNATTQPAPEVVEAMLATLREHYGNPSSLHALGTKAAQLVANARAQVARLVGASSPSRIVFTSGATESNNTAIRSALEQRSDRPRVVTTAVEHPAVLEPLAEHARRGVEIVQVGVEATGRLNVERVLAEIDARCALVSVMWANNETGVVHDVAAIARACRERDVWLHVDAVQACGKLAMRVEELGADFVSISAHKFHGPKGVGALYVRRGIDLRPSQRGGPQEDGRRGGTENVPGIVGLGRAAQLAREWLASDGPAGLAAERDRLERELVARIPDVQLHGASQPRVPNTINLRFEGLSGEALVALASDEGLHTSTGAACSSSKHRPSHVLIAMGLSPAEAAGSRRLSLSRYTTSVEVDAALEILERCVRRLRALSGGLSR